MGLFQHRPEEEENQWTLPSEPLERSEAEVLSTAPVVDPLALGLGSGDAISSIVFPVAPVVDPLALGLGSGDAISSIVFPVAPAAPAASSIEDREPEDAED